MIWCGTSSVIEVGTSAWPGARSPVSVAQLDTNGGDLVEAVECSAAFWAEVAVSRQMFQEILSLIARLRAPPAPACWCSASAGPPPTFRSRPRRFGRPGSATPNSTPTNPTANFKRKPHHPAFGARSRINHDRNCNVSGCSPSTRLPRL
jgi:hypothetical protein